MKTENTIYQAYSKILRKHNGEEEILIYVKYLPLLNRLSQE